MQILRIIKDGCASFAERENPDTARLWSGAPWSEGRATDERVALSQVAKLPPTEPSKIVCVGRNYHEHAAELGNEVPKEPLLFLKPPSSLLPHEGTIVLPTVSESVHHEGEIALVIGHPLSNASAEACRAGIFGVTCANDVTARDLQAQDRTFARAKGFDTFCPLGPWIDTSCEVEQARVVLKVNGATKQDGSAQDMVWSPIALLQYITGIMTLMPGDVVLTGTPNGVGPITDGDEVTVEIPGVGELSSRVSRTHERPDP